MSVDHLKKQAKNAKRLLPGLFEQHPPPYSLAECQELTAGLNGYPSWKTALESQRTKPTQGDDPIAAFYGYDWRKVSPDDFSFLANPEKSPVTFHPMAPDDAMAFIRQKSEENPRPDDSLVVINAAGELGGQVIDRVLDSDALVKSFGMASLATFSHRGGATFNPMAGLFPQQVCDILGTIIDAVASSQQSVCCLKSLDLLLDDVPEEDWDIPTIQRAVDRLIRLSNGGWAKNDDDFYETFPHEDRHDEAHALIGHYGDKLPDLLRPLDALLSRLSAPGLDRTFSPRLCEENQDWREEVFGDQEDMGIGLAGILMVNLDCGNELINYLAAVLVLAKVLYASRFHTEFGFTDATPAIDVVLIEPSPSD